jgi:hypothetical protein
VWIAPSYSLEDDVVAALWFSPEEFHRFREAAMMTATGIRSRNKDDSINPVSYPNVVLAAYKKCLEKKSLGEEERQKLFQWVDVAPSRRGLESRCIDRIRSDMKRRHERLTQAVLHAQADSGDHDSGMDNTERIRMVCTEITGSSSLFAKIVAEADANAAQKDPVPHVPTSPISVTDLPMRNSISCVPSPPTVSLKATLAYYRRQSLSMSASSVESEGPAETLPGVDCTDILRPIP